MTATAHISVSQGRKPVWPIAATSIAAAITVALALATVLPIGALLIRSLFDRSGKFIGGQNFVRYATEPGLSIAAWNSIYLAAAATSIVIAIAFPMAYAFTRSRMPARGILRIILLLPLLTPSLLPAFGLVYLFGNQGVLKGWLMGAPLYGPVGIIMASVFYALPHALLILSGGLAAGDARQYEAARALRAGAWRIFRTVTLPSARYSIISAASVVFVLVFTDFGIPTVIGGSTNVLATDIYKLVIGRFDFELGAVVGVLLLLPAIVAYGIDVIARRTERSVLSGKSVPIEPELSLARDLALLVLAVLVASAIIGIIVMAIFGSLVKFWPYNLTLGLHNYERLLADADDARSLVNSIVLAGSTALLGTLLVAMSGWIVARRIGPTPVNQSLQALAMVPIAVPGLVLGLGYVSFFNNPQNPLHGLQGTMLLIVICTVAHFYTVPHLMAVGGLMRLDREIDLAGQALRSGPVG
jgi:iron(III) transport system permease protein